MSKRKWMAVALMALVVIVAGALVRGRLRQLER